MLKLLQFVQKLKENVQIDTYLELPHWKIIIMLRVRISFTLELS